MPNRFKYCENMKVELFTKSWPKTLVLASQTP